MNMYTKRCLRFLARAISRATTQASLFKFNGIYQEHISPGAVNTASVSDIDSMCGICEGISLRPDYLAILSIFFKICVLVNSAIFLFSFVGLPFFI